MCSTCAAVIEFPIMFTHTHRETNVVRGGIWGYIWSICPCSIDRHAAIGDVIPYCCCDNRNDNNTNEHEMH